MQAGTIRLELEKIVGHDPLCWSRRKENPTECTCTHKKEVEELDSLIYQLLKKIK